jgi:tetratricopeptide (TPR) repeat protein
VVVKVPALPNAGQAAVFRRESRAASVLENPHLASFVGSGEVEGKAYLATAFVQGRPLSVLAEGGRRLDPRGAVDICRKLALALEDAHQCGLFHRRLAIEHVLIDRRQQPVLIGFGLGNSSATALPPEATGDPLRVGPAGDVWLLGALLYHLLTGTRPVGPDPEPPSAVRPDLDPALDAVCRKALATDPARRYARMSEFAEVLGRWLAGGLSRPANRPGSRRWRWAASTLAGCLALGLSGFAALSLHGPRVPIGTLTEDRRLADAAELTGRGWEANEKDHDFSRAEGLFDKALALDADSPRAYFGRGYARVFLGRPDLALADFDRACELDPDNPRHHNARGWALNERGRHDAAAVAATRALELSPRFVEAFITRATAYNHVGRTAEALRDAERALELAPGQPWALHNRGVARRALGQADLAAADFAEARKRDPSAGAP